MIEATPNLLPLQRRRFLGGLCLAWCGPASSAGEAGSLRARPIAEGVWFVQGEAALGSAANRNFISNPAFVVTDDGVVVIDALGSPALARTS